MGKGVPLLESKVSLSLIDLVTVGLLYVHSVYVLNFFTNYWCNFFKLPSSLYLNLSYKINWVIEIL